MLGLLVVITLRETLLHISKGDQNLPCSTSKSKCQWMHRNNTLGLRESSVLSGFQQPHQGNKSNELIVETNTE